MMEDFFMCNWNFPAKEWIGSLGVKSPLKLNRPLEFIEEQ